MITTLSMILIGIGVVFFMGTAFGMVRFPDYYTRVHAAGKGDTLSTLMIATGLAVYNLNEWSVVAVLTSLKIILICGFIFISSPTTSHVLMEAGYKTGQKPWKKEDEEEVSS